MAVFKSIDAFVAATPIATNGAVMPSVKPVPAERIFADAARKLDCILFRPS
jgi:hypothetical protein